MVYAHVGALAELQMRFIMHGKTLYSLYMLLYTCSYTCTCTKSCVKLGGLEEKTGEAMDLNNAQCSWVTVHVHAE